MLVSNSVLWCGIVASLNRFIALSGTGSYRS